MDKLFKDIILDLSESRNVNISRKLLRFSFMIMVFCQYSTTFSFDKMLLVKIRSKFYFFIFFSCQDHSFFIIENNPQIGRSPEEAAVF